MSNKYFRKHLSPAATTETAIYTAPDANTAIINSLRVTNSNVNSAAITVAVYPNGGMTGYKMLKSYSLFPNATMDVFSGVPCILEATDVLKVTASVASVDFYLSYLEIDRS
jgi:hypothetical protein